MLLLSAGLHQRGCFRPLFVHCRGRYSQLKISVRYDRQTGFEITCRQGQNFAGFTTEENQQQIKDKGYNNLRVSCDRLKNYEIIADHKSVIKQ